MKSLFLTSSFPKQSCDVSGVFIHDLAVSLIDKGIDVVVLAPHHKECPFFEVFNGIRVYRFPYFVPFGLQRLAYGAGIIKNIKKSFPLVALVPFFIVSQLAAALWVARKEKIDLIHAHWSIPQGVIGVLLKTLVKKPCITTIHGSDVFSLKGGFANRFNKLVYSLSDCVTVNSSATSDVVKTLSPGVLLSKLPMGVDPDSFYYKDRSSTSYSGVKRVLFVGRLIEWKGVDYLIKAVEIVCKYYPETQLILIGDGPEKPLLENLGNDLGLGQNITFVGNVPHEDVVEYYHASDVFVIPSIVSDSGETEGLGVVTLEAMACGVPVVGSRVGGIPDVVVDGVTGLLSEPKDPQSIAACILRLIDDRELSMILLRQARENVESGYSWSCISDRLVHIYSCLGD